VDQSDRATALSPRALAPPVSRLPLARLSPGRALQRGRERGDTARSRRARALSPGAGLSPARGRQRPLLARAGARTTTSLIPLHFLPIENNTGTLADASNRCVINASCFLQFVILKMDIKDVDGDVKDICVEIFLECENILLE
jgi:hypothetical protein